LDPICEIAWPIHSLRKSGSSLDPLPSISRGITQARPESILFGQQGQDTPARASVSQ
jgi:hypothetical protein